MAASRSTRKSELTGNFSLQILDQRAGLLGTTIANLKAPDPLSAGNILRLDVTDAQIKTYLPGLSDCLGKLVRDCETHNWTAISISPRSTPVRTRKRTAEYTLYVGELVTDLSLLVAGVNKTFLKRKTIGYAEARLVTGVPVPRMTDKYTNSATNQAGQNEAYLYHLSQTVQDIERMLIMLFDLLQQVVRRLKGRYGEGNYPGAWGKSL